MKTDDRNITYQVVMNDEEQYSVWPVDLAVPPGWDDVGHTGPEHECLGYIAAVWTDMRPRSLRDVDSSRG